MATADPELARIRALRRAIADRIEADLALLDALQGDPDLEPGADAEPSLCGVGTHHDAFAGLMAGTPEGDDREGDVGDEGEDVNEYGGDILDEPHDPDEREPNLGSLGGTAEGCEESQASWSAGDRRDREVSPDSPVHNQQHLAFDPGSGLTKVRAELSRYRYATKRGHGNVTLIGRVARLNRIGA